MPLLHGREVGVTESSLHVRTRRGSQCLQQLCKHFSLKVPVTFSPSGGRVIVTLGTFEMAASETDLRVPVHRPTGDAARPERFVSDHLARFAFRESPTLTWRHSA